MRRETAGDRIGSACWYKLQGEWHGGSLRAWSTAGSMSPMAGDIAPVAVVESDKDCTVLSVRLSDITFGMPPS